MDAAEFIHRRKGKYMAQILEAFEATILPHLPPAAAGDVQSFKGLVRARLNSLDTDAQEAIALGSGGQINGLALEVRDRLSPVGRP